MMPLRWRLLVGGIVWIVNVVLPIVAIMIAAPVVEAHQYSVAMAFLLCGEDGGSHVEQLNIINDYRFAWRQDRLENGVGIFRLVDIRDTAFYILSGYRSCQFFTLLKAW